MTGVRRILDNAAAAERETIQRPLRVLLCVYGAALVLLALARALSGPARADARAQAL